MGPRDGFVSSAPISLSGQRLLFLHVHVRVVYYDYATEEQPYCNSNTSCPRLLDHCLTGSLQNTHTTEPAHDDEGPQRLRG